MTSFWLIKSEPDVFSWDDLVREGATDWTGVRNHQAANHLRAMKTGDRAFFYHSNIGKEIVGIAEITEEATPDVTDPTGKFVMVRVKPLEKLRRALTLAEIKGIAELRDMALLRQSRLSVCPVTSMEWDVILSSSS